MTENHGFPQDKILQKIEGNKITLAINNPPLNVLSMDVLKELNKLLDEIEKNQDIEEVVITGNGKHFSAGANINEIKEIVFGENPHEEGVQFVKLGLLTMTKIYDFSKPVTAHINGTCLGGGMELAFACHKRMVVSTNAVLGFPETTIGIIPGWGGLEFVRNLKSFPERKSEIIEIVQKGLYLTSEEALEVGFVDEIMDYDHEPRKPDPRPYSSSAADWVSRSLYNGGLLARKWRIALDVDKFIEFCSMPDAKEGIEAFLDNRLPKFS